MARLDLSLFETGLTKSRQQAKDLILQGKISVNSKICKKPSTQINDSDNIEIVGELPKYVGRGGIKLERALNEFSINVAGLCCIDIGASTGGFTDCMLQSGADFVYAIDVGTDQLDSVLKNDSRVLCMENTDIRSVSKHDFDKKIMFAASDVSFISILLIMPKMRELLENDAQAVVLIKPQFEAGKSNIGKNGIVKDKAVHVSVLKKCVEFAECSDFTVKNICMSPIKGGSGNIEYLMHLKCGFEKKSCFDFRRIAMQAFDSFSNGGSI